MTEATAILEAISVLQASVDDLQTIVGLLCFVAAGAAAFAIGWAMA